MPMLSSTFNSTTLAAKELITEALVLGDKTSTGMVNSASLYPKDSDLVQVSYIDKLMSPIIQSLKKLDPDDNFIKNNNVITQSLTNEFFLVPDDWLLDGWEIQQQAMSCIGGRPTNSLKIHKSLYIGTGYYFLKIVIGKIESGELEVYFNNKWLRTLSEPGEYWIEIRIEDVAEDTITLVGKNVGIGEEIALSNYGFYYVTPRFYNYLIAKIRELSTVDASTFMPRDELGRVMTAQIDQFNQVIDGVDKRIDDHIAERNPHSLTCEDINASSVGHSHAQYVTLTDVAQQVTNSLKSYSKIDHIHNNYVSTADLDRAIGTTLQAHLEKLASVSPMVVTVGPTGKLPGRFATVGISAPSTIFWNSRVIHNAETVYDYLHGHITVDKEELIDEASKFFNYFSEGTNIPVSVTMPIAFRLDFHYPRRLQRYQIKVKEGQLNQWYVYVGNTTFVHRITNQEFETDSQGYKIYDIYLNESIECPSITFVLENLEIVENCKIAVDLDLVDLTTDQIGITPEEFSFCVPTAGMNRLITKVKKSTVTPITPTIKVENMPLYIFAGQELGAGVLDFFTSYYRPEYNNKKTGIDHFCGKFTELERDPGIMESYTHPAFGKLEMSVGFSEESYPVKNIYSEDVEGWRSIANTQTVTITQYINSDHVTVEGYLLSWRKNDNEAIPESWTLSVEGLDINGDPVTDVLDSVDKFYPFYSVEDDDIVYFNKCPSVVYVKKIMLTLNTVRENPFLSLNKLRLYLNERYYSISENKMYLGHRPVSQTCLGRAIYRGPEIGWEVTPVCYGASCTIPVNNLGLTEAMMEYEVDNPFFSDNVVVTPHEYQVQDKDSLSQVFITSIDEEKIKIGTGGYGIHAVTISRSW